MASSSAVSRTVNSPLALTSTMAQAASARARSESSTWAASHLETTRFTATARTTTQAVRTIMAAMTTRPRRLRRLVTFLLPVDEESIADAVCGDQARRLRQVGQFAAKPGDVLIQSVVVHDDLRGPGGRQQLAAANHLTGGAHQGGQHPVLGGCEADGGVSSDYCV